LRLITITTKITTHTQNMTPDSAMNDQKKSPNESNIIFSLLANKTMSEKQPATMPQNHSKQRTKQQY
jgi:hypothetical protein